MKRASGRAGGPFGEDNGLVFGALAFALGAVAMYLVVKAFHI